MATEAQVDDLIRKFDTWFQGRPNDPLINSERAIVKTFCWWLEREHGVNLVPQEKEQSNAQEGG